MNTIEAPHVKAATEGRASKDYTDTQAYRELLEILSQPFESSCDKCDGTGQIRDLSCSTCSGQGVIRIDFV